MSSAAPRLVDATIRIDNLPAAGRTISLALEETERRELAAFLKISAVEELEADLTATRFRGGIRVQGRMRATIVQPSVVTLEPVRQHIEEPVDRVFLPGAADMNAAPGGDVFVDLEGDDLPDPLEGPEADLSDMLIETLAIAIDLYPRAESESLADLGVEPDPALESPFAVLKTLKSRKSE